MLAGIFAGVFTGLIPGIHINLVSVLLVSSSAYFLGFLQPLTLAVFIVAMSVTHTFLDTIPSIYLGAPDPETALAVLPGHRMLLEGKGFDAVKVTIVGSLFCLIAVILISPLLLPFIPAIYAVIQPYMGYILIAVCIYMLLKEGKIKSVIWGAIIFLASGILGIIVLNTPGMKQPLLPMLSGLFGISTLIASLSENAKIPKQSFEETLKLDKKDTIKAVTASTLVGSIAGLLPGIGAAQGAIIAMQLTGKLAEYGFLILVGGLNTVSFVFSLVAFYTINKARNGSVVAMVEIIKSISMHDLIIFMFVALAAGGIATILTLKIAKVFAKMIEKIDYKKMSLCVIAFITILVFYFSSWIGILILLVSSAVGLLPPLVNVKRSLAMGCLMLPVILFFIL